MSNPFRFIDIKELSDKKTGAELEEFAAEFLEALGFIVTIPAVGADGGKDLIARETIRGNDYNWLVSCKDYSKTIGRSDEQFSMKDLELNECDGLILFYTNRISSSLEQELNRHKRGRRLKLMAFLPNKIETDLITDPRLAPVFQYYFPKSYAKLFPNKGIECQCSNHDCDSEVNFEELYLYSYKPKDNPLRYETKFVCRECEYSGAFLHELETYFDCHIEDINVERMVFEEEFVHPQRR